MDVGAFLAVFFRWLHIVAATVVIGGAFFMRFVLPAAMQSQDEAARNQTVTGCRAIFKRVVHGCIALLLLSGIYNSIRMFPQYAADPSVLHGLWAAHLLLALGAFGLSIWLFLGERPAAANNRWLAANLVLLVVVVAVGSALKSSRESRTTTSPAPVQDR
jgi:hypothetical protein